MFKKKIDSFAGVSTKPFTVKEIAGIIKLSREAGIDEIKARDLHIKFRPQADKIIHDNDKSGLDALKLLSDHQSILTDPSAFEKEALED